LILSLDPQGFVALRVPYVELPPGRFSAAAMESTETLVIDYNSAQRQVSGGVDRGSRVSESGMIYQMLVRDLNAALLCDDVQSIALDGLTGLANVVLEAVMHLNKRSKPNSQADYGDAIEKLVEIISVCTAARSKHFVLVSHIMMEKDELSGRIKEIPLVYGKQLPNRLLALFESRFQSAFSGDSYFWITKPTPLMGTIGTRLQDGLPEKIEQNFGSLFDGNAKPATSGSLIKK
jgi:hypothetical protein